MSVLAALKLSFARALESLGWYSPELVELIRQSQDPKFGDYQANLAMPLGKSLGQSPVEVAQAIVDAVDVGDLCEPPQIAGPGFINLRLRTDVLAARVRQSAGDPRLGISAAAAPRTFVVDYSAPNVAKPMHVGHIRSTVIGDALYRTLSFLGHRVIGDNHIGDWGTQFGMILYGYRNFVDQAAYADSPVDELARLYRLVRRIMDHLESERALPAVEKAVEGQEAQLAALAAQKPKGDKALRAAQAALVKLREERDGLRGKLAGNRQDADFLRRVAEHAGIESAVLAETARLHAGDEENVRLWREFMPHCRQEIDRLYRRLGVRFDEVLGESFYHEMLEPLVDDLTRRGIARQSDGATCIFFDEHATPMIVRKKDGAFLYATTDLATIRYRMERWSPDVILYVVDHRQGLHFQQLFAAAEKMELGKPVSLVHVSFGTVLGDDGRPFRTRAGDTVGLEGLLDEARRRAAEIVARNDDAKPDGAELPPEERARIAEAVGIAALKYADLSQNRTSDYVFSYEKMLAMNGNTATYMQYAYARVRSIFTKGNVDAEALRRSPPPILLEHPAERALAVELLRFAEALDLVVADYRPNQLTAYLFQLANRYSTFFEQCPVLRAETEAVKQSRLALCDLTARSIRQGLALLGIEVVEKM